MNNDEAKFLLSAYRPDGADAADAHFAEAMAQAERDPELAAWFQSERRFDTAMTDALAAIPTPRSLRTQILAGGKASRPRAWSGRSAGLALAAAIVLLAGLATLWFGRGSGLEGWQRDALAVIQDFSTGAASFDLVSKDPEVLRQYLQTRNAPAPEALPIALRSLAALGCKTITSGGRAVSIMCFKMGASDSIHLVVTDADNRVRAPAAEPRFVRENGWMTASWSEHGRVSMLATTGSEEDLRAVLKTAALAAVRGEGFVREASRPPLAVALSHPLR